MKIIATIDSFKGSATSFELNNAVLDSLHSFPQIQEYINIPIADGGEGTMVAIHAALGGEYRTITTLDPLDRDIQANYLITEIDGYKTAVIESAEIIGIHFIVPSPETIIKATSYGLGLVIQDALEQGIQKIVVTLGGSATSDGGLGMLAALGADLNTDATQQNPLLSFEQLSVTTLLEKFQGIDLKILSDVRNPYSGEEGAAMIFGTQKGGTPTILAELDKKAQKVSQLCQQHYQINLDEIAGTGAAGGLGGALVLIGGQIVPGFPYISELIHLEKSIKDASLIFTGEGRMDAQTEQGKAPYGIAKLAQKYQVPVIALCGAHTHDLGDMNQLLTAVFSIQTAPISLEEAMKKETTLANIQSIVPNIFKLFLVGGHK